MNKPRLMVVSTDSEQDKAMLATIKQMDESAVIITKDQVREQLGYEPKRIELTQATVEMVYEPLHYQTGQEKRRERRKQSRKH